jgi:hypothetical protein
MRLTDAAVLQVQSRRKPFKLSDARGLYLLVAPAGGKWWRFRYRFGGKHKTLSMGVYPDVSLWDARGRRDQARQLLAKGIDPGTVRREEKARKVADRLALKNSSTVRVAATLDGVVEIWKGRAVLRLTLSEMHAVHDLLAKLSA